MTKFLLALCLFALTATSCSSVTNALKNIEMSTIEGTTLVAETLKKNIDFNEWKIYDVSWMEGEELENELQSVAVKMVNKNNACFTQSFLLFGPGAGPTQLSEAIGSSTKAITFDGVKGITPEMINPEAIQKQYEAAKAMVPEKYSVQSVGMYNIEETLPSGKDFLDRDKTFNQIEASFDFNVIEAGKEVVESAGKKSIQYYEINFDVLPDGSVEMED